MTIDSTKFYSNEETVEVQFPKLDDFKNNPQLQSAFLAMWLSTLNATTNGGRREEGCYITLDTATGQYGVTPIPSIKGKEAKNDDGATMPDDFIFYRPGDIPKSPSPTDTAVYVVGTFHTHTPTTWIECDPPYRVVGPSPADKEFAKDNQLPGLVYDYIATLPNGSVPAGHPLGEDAKLYPTGFTFMGIYHERRSTP